MSGITNANDITIGIESVAGSIGLEHSQNIYPPSLYSIVFTPPSLSNAAPITDVAANWNDNEENKGIFLSGQGDDYVMISNVYNVGNQNVGQFNLTSEMIPLFGTPVVSNNITINGLNANHDTTIVFPFVFSPTNVNTYTFLSQHTGITTGSLTKPTMFSFSWSHWFTKASLCRISARS